MLSDALRKWNPWWADAKALHEYTGIRRTSLKDILAAGNMPHIKDMIGVRRSGKTTLCYQVIESLIGDKVNPKNIIYLNFDDPVVNATEYHTLEEEITRINLSFTHLFIDEAQQKKYRKSVV